MVAELIDGKAIALDLRTKIHDDIAQFQLKHPEFKPHLSIIQVGDRPDSNTYVKMKLKAAEELVLVVNLLNYQKISLNLNC